jgi:5-methylcytosine-specific restriction endonuclease McrA
MPTWEHIPCGTLHDHRAMRPEHCEYCAQMVPFGEGDPSEWRFIKPSKAERKARKARRRKIGPKKRKRVFVRDGWKCLRCGEDDKEKLTLDHIVPVSRGGSDEDENLQTLCKRCNEMKGNKTGSNGMRWPPDREMRRAGLARGLVR